MYTVLLGESTRLLNSNFHPRSFWGVFTTKVYHVDSPSRAQSANENVPFVSDRPSENFLNKNCHYGVEILLGHGGVPLRLDSRAQQHCGHEHNASHPARLNLSHGTNLRKAV